MKRLLAVALACALLLLSGCAQEKKDPGLKELDVILDWYPNAIHAFMYTAIDKGYFAEEGLKVNLRFPSNANDALSLVAAGQADIGLYYQQDMIQVRANQNVPVKAIGAVVQFPLNVVLSLKEKGIETAADLEGKRVGYAATELSEAMIRSMMEYAGADYSDVVMVDVGFDLMSSMTTGNVDATIGCYVHHEVPQLVEEGFDVSWMELTDYGIPNYYELVFLAGDKTIEEDRAALAAFLRACTKGFEDVKAKPEEALRILLDNQSAENFPLSESVERSSLLTLLPLMETQSVPFLSQTDDCWRENIEWMYAKGLIERIPELDEVRTDVFG